MAEISYPFNADNPTTGATRTVSELQWQAMANMWGGDRVDFQLGFENYSGNALPFSSTVNNVNSVKIQPGKAWVGGFAYELTAPKDLPVAANAANTGRIDLVVIRTDMSKPATNLAIRQGTNSASPVAPRPVRQAGAIWEMPLYEISVPANGGSISMASRAPYNLPPPVAFPWNAAASAALMPPGTFSYDADNNHDDIRNERYNDRSGVLISRTLGPPNSYTPALLFDSNLPSTGITYKGQWRWTAPNTVSFALHIVSNLFKLETDNGVPYGIRLPVPASGAVRTVFNGILKNLSTRETSYPSFTTLTGLTATGAASDYFSVYIPSPTSLANGLDNLRMIPDNATLYFSGTYEANIYDAWRAVNG